MGYITKFSYFLSTSRVQNANMNQNANSKIIFKSEIELHFHLVKLEKLFWINYYLKHTSRLTNFFI